MATNVLLIFPQPSQTSPQRSPPLSILHVGEALREAKQRGVSDETYRVRYFDERYDEPPDIGWADIVGVSSITGYQLRGAIRWLKAAKQAGKRTVLGGIHVTMQPEQCLSEDYVDAIVTHEGEWAFIDAIHGERKGNYSRHLAGTADHVSPVSDETLIHFRRSARTGDTILMSSRGCRFRCAFCYNLRFFNRSWQEVDLARWRRDVLRLKHECGVTKLEHGDDWIGTWARAREIICFLHDNGIQYRPSIRANQITDDVAREMKDLGIQYVSIGMETASPRILELTNKDITVDDQITCAHSLARYGIHPLYYWVTGLPTETPAEINETLDQADRMWDIHNGNLTQNFYAYLALPGSALWDMVDQSRLPHTMEEWSHYSLNQTDNELASNLYHIGGLSFHRGKGDKTDRNFPGLRRWAIAPFEAAAAWRWTHRQFGHYRFEKCAIEFMLNRVAVHDKQGGW